jgi:alpha-methylacyl-CoA racemase
VLDFDEAPRHRHARERGAFVDVDGVLQPAPAPRFDRTPAGHPRPAPEVGQHTDELLREAGCSAEDIAALRAAGSAR